MGRKDITSLALSIGFWNMPVRENRHIFFYILCPILHNNKYILRKYGSIWYVYFLTAYCIKNAILLKNRKLLYIIRLLKKNSSKNIDILCSCAVIFMRFIFINTYQLDYYIKKIVIKSVFFYCINILIYCINILIYCINMLIYCNFQRTAQNCIKIFRFMQ